MLYKDILFNNQGIKEVRCSDEVIWKKKISQLLQLMDVTGKSEARVNEICVRGKNIYAYCQREYKDRFIVKIANENGKLRVVNVVDLLSASEVFVCDPKLDDIVYVVGKINSNSYNDELLCIDMGTSQKKVAYSYNLGNINSYGYNNYGIVVWDGSYIHFFEHNKDRTGFSTITIKEYKYEKPVDMPNPSMFSREYSDKNVWYLSEPYNGSPDRNQVAFMLDYGLTNVVDTAWGPGYVMGIKPTPYFDVPYSLSSNLYDYVSNIFLYEENDVDMIYAFVSKDGKLFVFDDNTKKSFWDRNKTLKQKQDCFKIKLDVGNFRVRKCKYDRGSNLLFMSTENPVYENGKKIGFKVFKIDTKNNTSKLLASYETKKDVYTNYFGFDVNGTDVYVGCNENINGRTYASILYEQLSVPTPQVITENKTKVFLWGDVDGIKLSDMEACIKTTNYEIVGKIESRFVDRFDVSPEEQNAFLYVYNKNKDLIIIVGAIVTEVCGTIAETFKDGDPTYAGPLAGKSLGIKTYHITEPEIKGKIDPATYEEHVGTMETASDIPSIHEDLKSIRGE